MGLPTWSEFAVFSERGSDDRHLVRVDMRSYETDSPIGVCHSATEMTQKPNRGTKNVLIVHQSADLYGSDKVLLHLVEGLIQRGEFWPVIILPCHGPLLSALEALGAEVHIRETAKISRAMASPLGLFKLLRRSWRGVRELDHLMAGRTVNVVHSNTLVVLAGAAWAFRHRMPHLWHVHELVLSPYSERRLFPALCLALSTTVVANSEQTRRWLISEQPKLGAMTSVVFNGIPVPSHADDAAAQEFRKSVGVHANDVLVTLVGRISSRKGQAVLLDAFAVLKRRGQLAGLKAVVVGGPAPGQQEMSAVLRARAAELGLANSVHFRDFVEDIWPVWFASDIATVPSTEPESFGLVAIEAMAAGVPVIASRQGGLVDIIEDGLCGLLVDPNNPDALADAIETLAKDPVRRRQIGDQGRLRQRENFSFGAYVDGMSEIYRSLT